MRNTTKYLKAYVHPVDGIHSFRIMWHPHVNGNFKNVLLSYIYVGRAFWASLDFFGNPNSLTLIKPVNEDLTLACSCQ